MGALLSICISTYKRIDFLKRLLDQLAAEVTTLCDRDQELISINIFENPSNLTEQKEKLVKSYRYGQASCTWQINSTNIGGDANIDKCCLLNDGSSFRWVMGDDEQLLNRCLSNIITNLRLYPNCGLLILRDPSYQIHQNILDEQSWQNYCEFAKYIAGIQPHLLIAHTLITCNIFKTSAYSWVDGANERLIYSNRAGLPYCFGHMHGTLSGLSQNDQLAVHILVTPAIDVSSRAPSEAPEGSENIFTATIMTRLYRHYLYWLGHEFGIDIDKISRHSTMNGIFNLLSTPSAPAKRYTKIKGLVAKLKRISRRVSQILKITRGEHRANIVMR